MHLLPRGTRFARRLSASFFATWAIVCRRTARHEKATSTSIATHNFNTSTRRPLRFWRRTSQLSRFIGKRRVCRRRHGRSSSWVRPVLYSCVGDGGGPLGIGFQERVSNQSELLRSKA